MWFSSSLSTIPYWTFGSWVRTHSCRMIQNNIEWLKPSNLSSPTKWASEPYSLLSDSSARTPPLCRQAPIPFQPKPKSFSKLRSHLTLRLRPFETKFSLIYLENYGESSPSSGQRGPRFLYNETTNLTREAKILPSRYFTPLLLQHCSREKTEHIEEE